MRRRSLLLMGCLGCDPSGRVREPPPDGAPWLAREYAVEVELLASTCAPGGLTPEAQAATATAVQNGLEIQWAQRSVAPDAETMFLDGALCTDDSGAAVIRLEGGRLDTVDGCQVITNIPPEASGEPSEACDPMGHVTFAIDPCGVITATFDAELEYAQACEHRSPCILTVRITAEPTALDPRAPERPAECR